MKDYKNQSGFILVFSLMFMMLIIMLSTVILKRGRLHVGYSKVMLDKERAKMLALSGVQIAMTQLAIQAEDKKKSKESKKTESTLRQVQGDRGQAGKGAGGLWTVSEAKEFIKNVWPNMYEWQDFKLDEKNFGVDGEIKICIGSEEGKVDLNQIFDFETRKFVGQKKVSDSKKTKEDSSSGNAASSAGASGGEDFKKVFDQLFKNMGKFVKVKELQKKIEGYLTKKQLFDKILKNRQNKLYDPTEFFSIKEFEVFQNKVFYEPAIGSMGKEKGANKQKQTIYWTDIFTIWSGLKTINPWFVSPSIKRILKIKDINKETKKKRAEKIAKNFKISLSFPADWKKILEPLFGMKYENIPKWLKPLIATKFEPKVFSVLSYGKVGDISQKVYAIIERKKVPIPQPKGKKGEQKMKVEFDIKKFYWL